VRQAERAPKRERGLSAIVVRQSSGPCGWLAGPMAWMLNIGNAKLNRIVVGALDLRPGTRVLEVGYGGGVGLRTVLRHHDVAVYGVDTSVAMVRRAARRFRAAIGEGRLVVLDGSAQDIPLDDGGVDAAHSLHSIYFWPDQTAGLRELHRVVQPGGQLILGIDTDERYRRLFERHGYHMPTAEEAGELVAGAGFGGVAVEHVGRSRHLVSGVA
jgi:arsenite methyltransferase